MSSMAGVKICTSITSDNCNSSDKFPVLYRGSGTYNTVDTDYVEFVMYIV